MASRKAKSITVEGTRRVYDGFLKVDELSVSFDRMRGGGRIEGQRRLVLQRGDSVAALVHDTDRDKVLLVRQVRPATIAKGPGIMREIIAGMVEPGETAATSLCRELEEEIGYRVPASRPRRIGRFYLSPGGSSERLTLFYAPVTKRHRVNSNAAGVLGEGEDMALASVDRETLVRQALAGRIDDAKTLIAVLWLAVQRLRRS